VSCLVRSAGPKTFGPVPVPVVPEGRFRFRMGAVRSLPPSHPLKGKPVLVRIAAASSAALPSASAQGFPSEDVLPSVRLGCGWEGSPPLPEDRLGHDLKLSWIPGRAKRIPPVDNEDNVHNSRSLQGADSGPERRGPGEPAPTNAPLAPRAMPA
jgi:hypothetical protein